VGIWRANSREVRSDQIYQRGSKKKTTQKAEISSENGSRGDAKSGRGFFNYCRRKDDQGAPRFAWGSTRVVTAAGGGRKLRSVPKPVDRRFRRIFSWPREGREENGH